MQVKSTLSNECLRVVLTLKNVDYNSDANLNLSDETNFKKVWSAVDSFLDLGDPNKLSWTKLSQKEQESYWKIVAKLIRKGVVGYRYYQVNGSIERHFIEYEIANPRFAYSKVKYFDKKQYSKEWFV